MHIRESYQQIFLPDQILVLKIFLFHMNQFSLRIFVDILDTLIIVF
ncbi:UNVERIFIED_CONTAM: hypothetical protein NCL1_54471 [Trichonephila clavipes]